MQLKLQAPIIILQQLSIGCTYKLLGYVVKIIGVYCNALVATFIKYSRYTAKIIGTYYNALAALYRLYLLLLGYNIEIIGAYYKALAALAPYQQQQLYLQQEYLQQLDLRTYLHIGKSIGAYYIILTAQQLVLKDKKRQI